MTPLIVTVGLSIDQSSFIKESVDARVVAYPGPVAAYSVDGGFHIESRTVSGRFLRPDAVVYYSYFDQAHDFRQALALSRIPTFPDVRHTIIHDQRPISFMLANMADPNPRHDSGFMPRGTTIELAQPSVAKWSDKHCGDGKAIVSGAWTAAESSLIEPYWEGESQRVLRVGERYWQLSYQSADWRKNVDADVCEIDLDPALVDRTRQLTSRLNLEVAGVDFLVSPSGSRLLEVNAYPGFDEVAAADAAFLELAVKFAQQL